MSKAQKEKQSLLLMPVLEDAESYQWFYPKKHRNLIKNTPPVATLQAIAETLQGESLNPILVLPAKDVIIRSIELSGAERKHIKQTLPWKFEEDLPVRVEQLHFAHSKSYTSVLHVVATPKLLLREHLEALSAVGMKPLHVIAAPHLLAHTPKTWQCYYDGHTLSISTSDKEYYLCDQITAPTMFGALQQHKQPERICVWNTDTQLQKSVIKLFKRVKPNPEYSDTPLLCQFNGNTHDWPVNLLQGEFGTKISWQSLWQEWQKAVAAIVLMALMYTASSFTDYRFLRNDNLRLNKTIDALEQDIYPGQGFGSHDELRVAIEDEIKKLSGKSEQLKNSQFSQWMERVGAGLRGGNSDIALRMANYDNQKGTMRIEFHTNDYETVENIRDQLKQQGIISEIRSSAAKNKVIQTRLECRFAEASEQ